MSLVAHPQGCISWRSFFRVFVFFVTFVDNCFFEGYMFRCNFNVIYIA